MSERQRVVSLLSVTAIAIVAGIIIGTTVNSNASADADAEGARLPNGRNLTPVTGGVYPQDYYPNTEALAPTEMRITALDTGMPQVIQKKTKASGWYVELGNGDLFLFDLGTGSMENLAALQPDWSRVDKVFVSHLHSDHVGDFAPLYIGGWMNGRYTPLHIYGPSGPTPELGTRAFVENQVKAWAWDIAGRKGTFPDGGGVADVQEFDYKKVQVIVRDAVVSELALPTGTTQAYLDAYRTPTDANTKISDFVSSQRWDGFKPAPLPKK